MSPSCWTCATVSSVRSRPRPTAPPVTWQQLLAETGLDEATLRRLAEMNLVFLHPSSQEGGEPLYHHDNIVIGRLFKRAIELGIPLEALAPVAGILHRIATFEVDTFLRHVVQPMLERGDSAELIWASVQVGMNLAHSLVSLLHLHTLYRLILDTPWPAPLADKAPIRPQPPPVHA